MPSDQYLARKAAKREYSLTSHDLRSLSFHRVSGWGRGSYRYYSRSDLEKVAKEKHGSARLAEKRAKRASRGGSLHSRITVSAREMEDSFRDIECSFASASFC